MSNFDIKSFLINEGMTRVSRDRKRLLKESTANIADQDYEAYREWQKDNGWDDETINAAIEIWKQHPDMFAIELENPIVDDLEAFVAEPELYLSGDPEDLATAVKQNIYRR